MSGQGTRGRSARVDGQWLSSAARTRRARRWDEIKPIWLVFGLPLLVPILLGATGSGSGGYDPTSYFVNAGIVGVILVCVSTETLFVTKKTMDRALEERDERIGTLQADNEELKRMTRDSADLYNAQVVPALVRAVDLNKEYLDVLRRTDRRVDR